MRFVIRLVVTFIAVFVASALLAPSGMFAIVDLRSGAIFAAILAVLNALVRPIVVLLTCPIQILTLGLAMLVVNAVLFLAAGSLATGFGAGVSVDGFLGAIVAAFVVSIVSWLVSIAVWRS